MYRRTVQRTLAIVVREQGWISTTLEEELDDILKSVQRCVVQWGIAERVHGVRVSAEREEDRDEREAVRRVGQWGGGSVGWWGG